MKRSLILTLIAAALVIGLAWFLPHSFFSAELETPTPSLETPLATPTEPQDTLITYQNISFTIPVGLASSADAVPMPASEGPLDPSPAFIEFKLNDYTFPDPNQMYQPRIRIYPAVEYASKSIWAAESLNRLQSALVDHVTPLTNDVLPNVPYHGGAAQLYAAQVKEMPFQSGNGLRMISSYGQYPASIGRYSSFYHYEGLTSDGKYFVVVEMPVNLPVWADESNPGEFGITYQRQEWLYMQSYYQSVARLLDQASPEGFNPMLGQLDDLVQSIKVDGTPAAEVSPAPCLSPIAGTSLYTNADDGYCLLYPSRYSAQTSRFVIINPASGPGDIPGDAWVFIQVEDAAGRTAEQAVDAQMPAEMQGFNITRQSTTIDGELAFIIDGLPGQDSNRQVFIVHNDRLYTLYFVPWQPTLLIGGMGQRTPLEYLYNIVVQSFRFLP
jgi:hypothetical protein